jgi:uncharacterized protein YlxP (DUF503 family)
MACGGLGNVILPIVYTGTAVFDLLLPGDSRSLKAKRSYIRPIVAALRKFDVAAAEVGLTELVGRAEIGVAVVAVDAAHVAEVLDACERLMYGRPEVEVLAKRRRLHGEDDD